MVKKCDCWAPSDIERLHSDLQSSDEEVRGDAVRSLCPCHAGWEVFEQHVSVIFKSLRDSSHVVRAHALHVFDDAARMQSASDLRYHLEAGEERIGEKRASRFRSIEERLEARRKSRMRKGKRLRRGTKGAA